MYIFENDALHIEIRNYIFFNRKVETSCYRGLETIRQIRFDFLFQQEKRRGSAGKVVKKYTEGWVEFHKKVRLFVVFSQLGSGFGYVMIIGKYI